MLSSLLLKETTPLWKKKNKPPKTSVANCRFAVLGLTSHSYGKGQICSWKFDLSNYISWLWYETLSLLIWSCMSTWLTQMEYCDPWSLSHHLTNATAVHNPPSKQGLPDQIKTQCTEFPFLPCMTLLFIPAGRHPMHHQASIFNNSKCNDTGTCNFTFKSLIYINCMISCRVLKVHALFFGCTENYTNLHSSWFSSNVYSHL